MKTVIRQQMSPVDDAARIAAIADAWNAADTAAARAASAGAWADRGGANIDDAAEAVQAALRARLAAERAEHAPSGDLAWRAASEAWAATTTAIEADARVVADLVNQLSMAA